MRQFGIAHEIWTIFMIDEEKHSCISVLFSNSGGNNNGGKHTSRSHTQTLSIVGGFKTL